MKKIISPSLLTFVAFIVSSNNDEEKSSRKEITSEQNEAKEVNTDINNEELA